MDAVTVCQYNAFSKSRDKGNPAGVVYLADKLSDKEMQRVAERVGLGETVFILRSNIADYCFRYFTPGHEIDLCGHATVAATCHLLRKGHLKSSRITVETNIGVIDVRVERREHDGEPLIVMDQAPARFEPFLGSALELASSIGISAEDVDPNLPIVYGSTGVWTLLVPIKSLETFEMMRPHNVLFPEVLLEKPEASIHPFCTDTFDPTAHLHGRHFSSPFSKTVEDPVTGTASGAMGAYYAKYVESPQHTRQLIVEQGHEINRDGRVVVQVTPYGHSFRVRIGGIGVFVRTFQVECTSGNG